MAEHFDGVVQILANNRGARPDVAVHQVATYLSSLSAADQARLLGHRDSHVFRNGETLIGTVLFSIDIVRGDTRLAVCRELWLRGHRFGTLAKTEAAAHRDLHAIYDLVDEAVLAALENRDPPPSPAARQCLLHDVRLIAERTRELAEYLTP